jgi:LTXXQ motif family protein
VQAQPDRRGPAATAPGIAGQPSATRNANLAPAQRFADRARSHGGILRNPTFASLAPRNPDARSLAHSTFRGGFARSQFAFAHERDRGFKRHLGFVLGFVGPVFWPYAYSDFVDYTFWPYAYDTFWPYAFDDVYQGIYGGYAPQYVARTGVAYATAGKPASSAVYRKRSQVAALPGAGSQICSGQSQGLTDFPIERIAQQVEPTQDQQRLLDDLKAATAKAVNILQAACPSELESTPTGRFDAMRQRVTAMLQAVQVVQPALDLFYQSLSDEQKERFNALDQAGQTPTRQGEAARLCSAGETQLGNLPIQQIRRSLRLSDTQNSALDELNDASAKAADVIRTSCPRAGEQALTPPGRLAVMAERLQALQEALDIVEPALANFYGSLSDEQKARINRLSGRPT